MPRYYFHVRSPAGVELDPQGVDFDTVEDAIADARKAGAEILLDRAVEEKPSRARSEFEIVDDAGTVIARVPFGG